jgi:hypothetical protein
MTKEIKKRIIYFIIILIIFIGFIILICNWKVYKNNYGTDNFVAKRDTIDPDKDGKMTFEYLNDVNYKNTILNEYYMNDDIIVNGSRLVDHPLQKRVLGQDGRYYYGRIDNIQDAKASDFIYNQFGIRL